MRAHKKVSCANKKEIKSPCPLRGSVKMLFGIFQYLDSYSIMIVKSNNLFAYIRFWHSQNE